MRLFIAIDCNSEKEYFKQLQSWLPNDAKLSLTNDFHLTLKFLGEVMPHKIERVRQALQAVEFSPFSFSLGTIGVFPDEKFPRVVWVGVEPKEHVVELQKCVERALHGMFEGEKRFHPHITLARVKHLEQPQGFIRKIKTMMVEKKVFSVEKCYLVKSTLTPHGSVYEHILSVRAEQQAF
jgi:2'-5' RNA ligase